MQCGSYVTVTVCANLYGASLKENSRWRLGMPWNETRTNCEEELANVHTCIRRSLSRHVARGGRHPTPPTPWHKPQKKLCMHVFRSEERPSPAASRDICTPQS